MIATQLDKLDEIATACARGHSLLFGTLSRGQQAYVAMACSSALLLSRSGFTIPQALDALDDGWADELARRWWRVSRERLDELAAEGVAELAVQRRA